MVLSAGEASAAPCGTPLAAPGTCTATGTLSVNAGNLTLTTPTSLTWGSLLNGLPQTVVDNKPADQVATINDASGTGDGWNVTLTASTFTNGTSTLPDTGTLSFNGSTSSASSPATPTVACVVASACTLPVPSGAAVYPLAITTAPGGGPTTLLGDATAGSGIGNIQIGGSTAANPIGWWVNVPATALAGNYVSNLTASIAVGP